MKLLSIRLENVRCFIDPVEITGIGSGLNVLSAPNERGKSTIFDALHALFFKGHRSWDKDVSGLAPHAGGDPEVAVDVEIGTHVFRVEKRWNKGHKGEVRVHSDGHLFKQADDAEAWLGEALKAPKEGGPAGLLWVRQGLTGLDDGDMGRTARRDLLSSVAGEVEAMTGGRRMDGARDRCSQELDRYVTKNGKAKAGGPLKLAGDEAAGLEARQGELAAKAAALSAELDRRRDLRRELAGLQDPEADAARKARQAEAVTAHAEASRHAEALERATEMERVKRLEMERAEERLAALQAALGEAEKAEAVLQDAKKGATAAAERQREAEVALADATTRHDEAARHAETASDIMRRALRAETAVTVSERRAELMRRLAEAEELRTELEQAAADAKVGLPAQALEELETLDREVRILRKTRETEATAISMRYTAGRDHGIELDGRALPGGERVAIPDGATLEIDGIGRLTVHPGSRAGGDTIGDAESALTVALNAADQESLEAARVSARQRVEAEARHRDAESRMKAVAPDGIDALHQKIAELPEPVDADTELPSVVDAQEADTAAKAALIDARETLEAAREAAGLLKTALVRATTAVEGAEDRAARARAALTGYEDAEAEKTGLAGALSELRTALGEATRQRETIVAAAPDLEAATAALERARSVVDRADEDQQRIRIELGKLDTAIDMHAAEAIEEELVDVETRLETARHRLKEIEFEVAVLQKLEAVLDTARATARDRYVEPVLKELEPLVRLIWPEAELRFDAEDVLPTALVRAGTEEDFDILSGGTQEQIALLVRLAFARMLANSGHPAPVILDDAIVYTDDDRIERMFDALTRQAQDLQILVFSCRQKAFRDLGGRSLTIAPANAGLQAAQ